MMFARDGLLRVNVILNARSVERLLQVVNDRRFIPGGLLELI